MSVTPLLGFTDRIAVISMDPASMIELPWLPWIIVIDASNLICDHTTFDQFDHLARFRDQSSP